MTELLAAVWGVVRQLFASEETRAVLIALGVGGFGTEFLAHTLPHNMDAWQADRVVRLTCLGLAWITAFGLVPTVTGFFVGLFAGLAAPTLYSFATRAIYAKWPAIEPKALKP